jgi:hypothetical protein
VAYNAELDQILLSVHNFSEVWIIDHTTTSAQARGHSGGKCGRGGDLLYRWGNPQAYNRGSPADQQLFEQHDATWIPAGLPGAGHILVFNNQAGRQKRQTYSSVDEIAPPLSSSGAYEPAGGKVFGPQAPLWRYTAAIPADFYSGHISGAQRLANGNTLICSGERAEIFETTADGRTVWDYVAAQQNRPAQDEADRLGPPPSRDPRDHDPGGPGGPGGLFRATRYAANDPRIAKVLGSAPAD